jgi:CO/xanthine dehydrogenase Mo-binding subunit
MPRTPGEKRILAISLTIKDGALRLDRVVVAVDCGQVIHPNLVASCR